MDRIDTQGPKGLAPAARAKSAMRLAGPEARSEGAVAKPAETQVASLASAGVEAPVDHARVAEIRQALDEGRYQVAPAKIADAMIASGVVSRMRG